MNQTFNGEHLLPGQLGHLFVIIAFVAALFAAFAYFKAACYEDMAPGQRIWKSMARAGFLVQVVSVIGIFIALYYIISHHLFEYHYAWKHSSRGLKTKYLLACFWEGSEGSFLLWIVWHSVLGLVLLRSAGQWESRVMTVVCLVQAVLCTMLLGIYLGPDIHIGSTPFSLLRDEIRAPIFSRPDYLQFIKDGNGLNPLLQNYWMVIHPPVLFLGFAFTLIPFAYAIAAMWKGDYKSWVKPALRWALLGGAVLGTGIMMGGAWAYESLNFGGYWAWDPVENASLVPWLVLIAGLHTLVIYKSTGRSLKITLVFFILSFLLVWYSTFLTRTGVLGDTSVHAFTEKGKALYYHLIIVICIYLAGSIGLLIRSWRRMPRVAGEEEVNTREFWMLIGSVFLLLASAQISFYTSLPVWAPLYNKITGTQIAPPEDPVAFYNNIQVWFAIIIALLSGAIQYLKYKKTGMRAVWIRLGLLTLLSILLAILLVLVQNIMHVQIMVFAFAVIFTIIANLFYLIGIQKTRLLRAGAAITHTGFGLMLLGILLSGYKKQVISLDRTGRVMDFGKETFEENVKESRENVLLFRNTTIPMGDYMVTYLGDSTVQNDPPITYFKVKYQRRNKGTNALEEEFYLYPDAFVNPKGQEGISSNPASKHYWTHDVFSYVTSISAPGQTDTSAFHPVTVKKGDTIYVANGFLVYENLTTEIDHPGFRAEQSDMAVQANLGAYNLDGKMGALRPLYLIKGNRASGPEDTLRDLGLQIRIEKIIPDEEKIEFGIRQRAQQDDYIVMKVLLFPYIRVLWGGIVIMVTGFFISFWSRKK